MALVSIPVNDQLLLRSYDPADAGPLFNTINENRQYLHPWLGWVVHTTKQENSLKFIEDSNHQLKMQEAMALGIFYNGELIGGIGMHNWNKDLKRAEIGYWLSQRHEGRGVISASMKAMLGFLFERTSLNKVEIHFIPGNKRSAAVATRAGFKVEGIIRQGHIQNGKVEDLVVMGLLRSEWREMK